MGNQDAVGNEIATTIITEIFKTCLTDLLQSAKDAAKWLHLKGRERDILGTAADRYTRQLENRYNFIRILGMGGPIPLRDVFVRVNILDKITSRQRISIDDLKDTFDYDRRSFGTKKDTISGHDLIGKPRYQLSYSALNSLRMETLPMPVHNALSKMPERAFDGKQAFIKALLKRIETNSTDKYKKQRRAGKTRRQRRKVESKLSEDHKDLIVRYASQCFKKLIVLGKPGAGKTTLLKSFVLQCTDGHTEPNRVPIFISLKDLSDSPLSLMQFIVQQFDICKFPDAKPFIERMLTNGNCLILLDGLDEVRSEKLDSFLAELRDFSEKYGDNQFIISCRIAAYNYWFDKFTDVEIADFDNEQIKSFVTNWFRRDNKTIRMCLKRLRQTPQVRELATNPLLLTLLCLAFEQTLGFPENRAELYKEAIDALLGKWDASRRITRAEIYKHLSRTRKETMFSTIAAKTFERGEYFLPQRTLEHHITEFIKNLRGANEASLAPDSESVLKAIESHHGIFVERAKGIYSFSHLTFQEYFTAKYIVEHVHQGTLNAVVENHFDDDRWREVILLTAGLLPEAEQFLLLLKNKVDRMSRNPDLQLIVMTARSLVRPVPALPTVVSVAIALLFALKTVSAEENCLQRAVALCRSLGDACSCGHVAEALNLGEGLGLHNKLYKAIFHRKITILAKLLNRSKNEKEGLASELISYFRANQLVADCICSECYVDRDVRQQVLEGLLSVPQINKG